MAEDRGFSDLFSSASSLLNSQSHSSSSTPSHGHASGQPLSSTSSSHTHKPSYGEVYASAQVVMDAAKHKLHNNEANSAAGNTDYGKLAGAAGTLLNAASHYGNLEETGVGKYAQKAQEYLHSYEGKHSKPGMTVPPSQSAASHSTGSGYHPSSVPSEINHSHPSANPQGYSAGYPPQINHSHPSANPQDYSAGYPPQINQSHPSGNLQGYSAGYPPQGYPHSNQNYGAHPYSRPAESQGSVDNYPPAGYPSAGYPTSGGNYYN